MAKIVEISEYAYPYSLQPGALHCGDCNDVFDHMQPKTVDLVFADPPFNIGYEYEDYIDSREEDDYLAWCRLWLAAVYRALTPTGTFWMACGDKFISHLDLIARDLGFAKRNWVIWYYKFGTYTEHKFARNHGHLIYYVKDIDNFIWNPEAIRVPSERQATYGDRRADSRGRVPGSVWEIPRVCGTFKERCSWHPCQMPLAILDRIIKACSDEGDVVLDPFSGSGTTIVSAYMNARTPIGIEVSREYCDRTVERFEQAIR